MAGDFKNILIIKPSSLGDIVLTLPALSALRRSFPDAEISWLIRPEFAQLLQGHPHLDETVIFDRRLLGKAWYHPKAVTKLLSLIKKLRLNKYDVVFDLQGLFRTGVLAWLSGCKNRYGKTTAREFAGVFYTHRIAQDESCVHVVDYCLKVIETAGASDVQVEFVLPVDNAAADSVRKLLADCNIDNEKYVVFVPGSAHKDKCWPVEKFASLADKISLDFGLNIAAVGSKSEFQTIEALKSFTKVPIANFAGTTEIKQLVALLSKARLVVSNDTGPGHIAAALGKSMVMIFGRSNPARIHPYGRSSCVVAIEPNNRGWSINNNDPKYNIKAVTVDDVYNKIIEQLQS